MKMKLGAFAVLLLLLLIGLRLYRAKLVRTIAQDRQKIAAAYACDGNRTFRAVFLSGKAPRAEIELDDGRKLVLKQVLSASGARYANADESIVLWLKGDTAFIEEGAKETYSRCKLVTGGRS